jgi:hypothetical integral membrane protein (TIGR02206 family)
MVRLNRSDTVSARTKHAANVTLAVILMAGVVMDPLCAWLRYRDGPGDVARLVREDSLPLHLCDIVSFVLAWALVRRNQRCAELGYLWGLAGTLQGVLTPAVKHDWPAPEYFGFFAQHGGVIVAGLALAFGAGLAPEPGALRRAMLWSWTYMAVVCALNALLGTNYGYFNAKPDVASLLDYLGPWPWYLLSLQGVALVFFSLLLLPFEVMRRKRGSIAVESLNR